VREQPGERTSQPSAAHDPRGGARHGEARRGTSRYGPWTELLRRTFGLDVETCPRCGGRMRLLALVTEPKNVERFLRHLGEPTEPPPRAPARDPLYWHGPVLRRRHEQQSAETTQMPMPAAPV
jgi:hypothetical protein